MQTDRRQVGPVEHTAHRLIGTGLARERDHRKAREVAPGHLALAEAEDGACQEVDVVVAQHPALHVGRGQRSDHESELDLLREQPGRQVRRDVDLDLQRQVWIDIVHTLHQLRQPGVHNGLGDAEPQHAAHRGTVADLRHHLRAQADQLLGIDKHLPSARRRRGDAVIAVQEFYAHLALELGDALGNRGLCGVHALRGAAEAAELRYPEEGLD